MKCQEQVGSDLQLNTLMKCQEQVGSDLQLNTLMKCQEQVGSDLQLNIWSSAKYLNEMSRASRI